MRRILFGCLIVWTLMIAFVFTAGAEEYALSDLYQHALNNSEKIKFAQENLYIAQIGKDKAWSLLVPRLTAFGTYNHFSEQKITISGVLIQPSESGNWGVRMDESFSLSARELNALKFAGQNVTKTAYDLEATKSDFVLAVASAYYDALKAKKSLEIAAANMERLLQYRDSIEKRVKVGDLTKTALLRAEGELSGARSDYLKATNALKLARAALIRITGIEDEFRLRETPVPAKEELAMEILRKTALEKRSDLKSFDMQITMAEEQVKYAKGAFWPNVSLFAIYNGSDQYPASGLPATQTLNRESVLAGVGFTFPFFEGGLRIAELKEANSRKRQAKLVYDDFKKNIEVELQAAYLDLETQRGTLKFLEDQLAFAEDNYNAVIRQFDNGLALMLDVLDANSLLLSSERNVADALYSYQLAYLKLKRTSGMLLQFVLSSK